LPITDSLDLNDEKDQKIFIAETEKMRLEKELKTVTE
jgi:hypothetical protein